MKRLHKTEMDQLIIRALENLINNASSVKTKEWTANKIQDPTAASSLTWEFHMMYGFEKATTDDNSIDETYGMPENCPPPPADYTLTMLNCWGSEIFIENADTHKKILECYWDRDDGWCTPGKAGRNTLCDTRDILKRVLTEAQDGKFPVDTSERDYWAEEARKNI